MKFSTNFVAMLSLVGRIKFSLNCHPALELRDITHVQCTYTHLFTGRISKLGLHPLQSYGCIRITSWITLVFKNDFIKDHVLNSIFIPIQISYSSPTAILPEILIVTYRRDLRTFTEITEKKIQKSLHLNKLRKRPIYK